MYLLKYTIKRLLMLIPVILGVTLILYYVMALSPGNPSSADPGRRTLRRSRSPRWSMRWAWICPS